MDASRLARGPLMSSWLTWRTRSMWNQRFTKTVTLT